MCVLDNKVEMYANKLYEVDVVTVNIESHLGIMTSEQKLLCNYIVKGGCALCGGENEILSIFR